MKFKCFSLRFDSARIAAIEGLPGTPIMPDHKQVNRKHMSADWFLRGALTRIGDTFDRFTGRRWTPSSSLATSELVERMKRLLDSEAKEVPGKGRVVPHNIRLKMQWDKFSTDSDEALKRLENELLTAAADHINDSLYYTYAPLHVEVKPDYFTEGVKLYVGFDKFSEDEPEVELNVTITGIQAEQLSSPPNTDDEVKTGSRFMAKYDHKGYPREMVLEFPPGYRASVGRTASNDIVLDDPSVSKIHASLGYADGNLIVADTGSTNGTFINGERIEYGKAIHVDETDTVKFGNVEMRFSRLELQGQDIANPVTQSHKTTIAIEGFEFSSRSGSDDDEKAGPEPGVDDTGEFPPRSVQQVPLDSAVDSTNSTGPEQDDKSQPA